MAYIRRLIFSILFSSALRNSPSPSSPSSLSTKMAQKRSAAKQSGPSKKKAKLEQQTTSYNNNPSNSSGGSSGSGSNLNPDPVSPDHPALSGRNPPQPPSLPIDNDDGPQAVQGSLQRSPSFPNFLSQPYQSPEGPPILTTAVDEQQAVRGSLVAGPPTQLTFCFCFKGYPGHPR